MAESNTHIISQAYAQIVYELAKQQNCCERVDYELDQINQLIAEQADFGNILQSPFVKSDAKIELAEKVFSKHIDKLTAAIINALINSGRIRLLGQIAEQFRLIFDKDSNKELIKITLASDVSEEEKTDIENRLSEAIGRKLRVKYSIDPSIIGGIIIRCEGEYIDNSLLKALNQAKEKLQSTIQT